MSEIKDLITKEYSIKKDTQIISTCGSGVTACILALALKYIGIIIIKSMMVLGANGVL